MIKVNKGDVSVEGNTIEIMAEISTLINALLKNNALTKEEIIISAMLPLGKVEEID